MSGPAQPPVPPSAGDAAVSPSTPFGQPTGLPNPRVGRLAQPGMGPEPGTDGRPTQAQTEPGDARHLLISNLTRNVTARLDLGDVLAATLSELRLLLRFGGGSIQLIDDDGWIRLAAADPAATDELFDVRIPLDSTVAGRIVLSERPVYLPDLDADHTLPAAPPKANLSPGGVRSYFGVPLLAEGHAIGVLQIDSPDADAWDDTERMLVVCVAPVVAAAIQNARSQARVTAMQVNNRRIIDRWRTIVELLETDVDASLTVLVEMAEYVPSMRDEVDRLTAGIARLRAVAAVAESRERTTGSVDLRSPQQTRS
jgi:GAF domain-containing protein